MEQVRSLQKREEANGITVWQIFSGVALILGGLFLILNLPDIKRYIKIMRM
jgi:hypothetical protein